MAKQKLYRVDATPVKAIKLDPPPTTPQSELPEGQKPSVMKRTAIRTYEVLADSPADAKKKIEETERAISAAGHPEYKIGKATAL